MAIKFWKILKMVKSSVQATASLGVAGKTTGGFRKKKKKENEGAGDQNGRATAHFWFLVVT